MTITYNNNHKFNHRWKGFHYGKTAITDQIACGFGQRSSGYGHQSSRPLLSPIFPPRLYSSTDFCCSGSAAVFSDRLSRDCQYSSGLIGYQKNLVLKQNPAFHHAAKGPTAAFKKNIFQRLLAKIFDKTRAIGLTDKTDDHATIDSTGLENHFVSRHFIMRQGSRSKRYRKWTKLTIVCQNENHLIAAASVGTGPSTDCHYLAQTVKMAVENVSINTLIADSGYDSEYNHQFCHNQLGIAKTVIAVNDRNRKYSPMTGYWRKLMNWHFPKSKYRQRWQVESVFSRFKRRLGYALRARNSESRAVECLLRVVTYNLMVVLLTFEKSYLLSFSTKQIEYLKLKICGTAKGGFF
jgi:hypothetical protein